MEIYNRLSDAYMKFREEFENENFDVEQQVVDLEHEALDALDFTVDN